MQKKGGGGAGGEKGPRNEVRHHGSWRDINDEGTFHCENHRHREECEKK